MHDQGNLIDNRTIRVFISSTFQDMQDERTELIRKTFPRLREMAARRDVTLTEVDLRWGITQEESESGKVMEICLREVENSIPFFIGIIGNRYGWVPGHEDVSDIVKERFRDVPHYVERQLSATEIEMQFGVLDRKDVDMNAYFFIKDEEIPENEILKRYPTETTETLKKLAELKKGVRENKKYPVSTYSDPEDLANQVLATFTKLLDDLFPVGELSALEKERLGQRAVLNNLSRVYIKNDSNYAVIDEWMEDWEKHQLVITGESGLGKSALAANWVKEKLESGDALPYRIIYHFVGDGGSICSDGHVVKALCDEIRDRYGFDAEENESKTDEKTLDELFMRVAAEGDKPLLIVLDGINQIIDVNHAKRLNWLPIPPRKVKILFTTLEDDETMQVFKDRHYPVFTLRSLTRNERIDMVSQYLDRTYRKHLENAQLERIVDDPQNENTLVLKTLLDEIANFGSFEKLDEKIEEYLKPDSIGDFYQVLLKNYEADFGEDLVRHFLSLIAVSRNGLSEDEILDITNTKDKPILWSQFFCSFRQHMIVKEGLVSFAHSYIRKAVEDRYINGKEDWECITRESIIENQKRVQSPRAIDEISYQYYKLGDLNHLHSFLLYPMVFSYLEAKDEIGLGKYWNRLIEEGGYSFKDYLKVLSKMQNKDKVSFLLLLSRFSREIVVTPEFSSQFSEKAHSFIHDPKTKAKFYFGCGESYSLQGKHQTALDCFKKALEIRTSLYGENHSVVAETYNSIGLTYSEMGYHQKAFDFVKKALSISIILNGESCASTATYYNNLGAICIDLGNASKTVEYLCKSLAINRNLFGDYHRGVAQTYGNLGSACWKAHETQMALEFEKKALAIQQVLYGENHPDVATSYNNLGFSYEELGDYRKALEYKETALKIRLSLFGENHPDVAASYNSVGYAYKALGQINKANDYFRRAAKRWQELGDEKQAEANLKEIME